MKSFVILGIAVLLFGCGSRERSQLMGVWTPVSIGDCSATGTTVTIDSSGLTYRSGNAELKLMQISAFRDSGSRTDIDARTRIHRPTGNEFWHPEATMRFEMGADRAQLLGKVSVDGALTPADSRAVEELTLRRCP